MFIELISIVIAFIFLLYWSGIGLTRLIIPERFKDYELLVIPFLGLFTVLFFAHIFSAIGYGTKDFTWFILLLITPLNIYAVWKVGSPYINLRETLPVFGLAGVVFIIGMIPLFFEGYLTVVGINGDAAHYTLLADHFLTNGVEPPKDKGIWVTSSITFLLTSAASRIGPMYFQSMIGAVTGLEGYKTFTVLINLFNSIMLISAYLFARGTGLLSKKGSLFAVILLGINSLLYWSAINDYLAQVMMRAVLPLALVASLHMFARKDSKSLFFSIAVCSTILMASPESMVLLLAPLFFFAALRIFRKELLPGEAIKIIIPWALLLAIINILPISATFKWLYNLFSIGLEKGFQAAAPGDVDYFIPLTQVFGFTPPYYYVYREILDIALPLYLAYFYASYAAVFIVLLLAVYAVLRTDRQRQSILLSISAPYLLIALWMRFTFPYGYFKIASLSPFLIATIYGCGIGLIFEGCFTRLFKMLFLTVTALIVLLSLMSSYILLDMVVNDENEEWIAVDKELIALKDIQKNIKEDKPIFLEEGLSRHGARYFWIAYLMQDREVLTRKATLGTEPFRDKELDFSYVVYPKSVRIKRIEGNETIYERVPAALSDRYQQYADEGWVPVVTTSRYIMLGKR